MLIVRFGGGLGNQLFQFAMMISLEKTLGEEIKYDDSSYSYFNEHEGFDLPKYFSFSYKKMDMNVLKKISPLRFVLTKRNLQLPNLKVYSLVYKVDRILSFLWNRFIGSVKVVRDIDINAISEIRENHNEEILYFDGKWQNISLYDLAFLRDNVRFQVNLDNTDRNILNNIHETVSVSVHIRRGDFTTNTGFNICSEKYYMDAIDRLLYNTGLSIEHFTFFFFGDDHKYIEKNYQYPNMTVVQGSTAGVDMYLMSNCKYNIIANSTFSFWGAFLNKTPEMIIAPKYSFYNDKRKELFSVPASWISIDNVKGDL